MQKNVRLKESDFILNLYGDDVCVDTPIYDFLTEYSNNSPLRAHMPGHKGISPLPELESLYSLDITEISGADSLFEAEGIIKKSEENASALFGTEETVYSCGGSTLCIQAMLFLMKQENRCIIAGRTVHKSFLNACILLGLKVTWIYPKDENGILSGRFDTADFEKALLDKKDSPCCVYITSPDYLGNTADIAVLSEICRRFDAPLLVDNAHGAHLAFFSENVHPMALGADLCCDSAHKTLPCLTGSAYLHTSSKRYKGRLKSAMSMFGSTSPSYLMLLSLDLCNVFLQKEAKGNLEKTALAVRKMKKRLQNKYIFAENSEPLHVVIDTAAMGISGTALAKKLEEYGCFAEYAGTEALVLLLSAAEKAGNLARLEKALQQCGSFIKNTYAAKKAPSFTHPETVTDIRSAALSGSELIPVEKAAGRICAGVHVPCPPAIPIVISGELIDEKTVEVLKFYNISKIEVMK